VTRETRLVAILFAVSIVGVTTLAFIADQYRKHLGPHVAAGTVSPPRAADAVGTLRPDVPPAGAAVENAGVRAAREVAGFLAAREAVRGLCVRESAKLEEVAAAVTGDDAGGEGRPIGSGSDVIATYRAERLSGFAAHGMGYADYVAARTAWRAWSASEPGGDAALAAAFEERRAAAEKAGLGEFEALDDAIK
jgi:hypothetical protein